MGRVVFKSYKSQTLSALQQAGADALEEFGQLMVDDCIPRTPVDTGNMKHEWTYDREGLDMRVGNTAEYAGYNEAGFHAWGNEDNYVPPRPMLQPSFDENKDEFPKIIEKHFGNI